MTFPFSVSKKNNARRGLTLATGQTTQYASELDDGHYEKGLAMGYVVLSAGAYSGTTNIDLAHYTSGAGAVTFDNTAKTIVDTGNGLAIFKTNDVILTDDVDNPGPFTVTTGNVAGTITCTGATFVDKTAAGTVTISKREAHSNNCVLDLRTGLLWSRYVSDKMGPASDGLLPWTTHAQGYGIFAFAAAANTASLAGHADWYVCNAKQIHDLADYGTNSPAIGASFASFPTGNRCWTSTTSNRITTNGITFIVADGTTENNSAKTANHYVLLVRGG